MQEQGLREWEKHAQETYSQLINSKPTKENAILLASALTILGYEKLKEMEYKLMGKENRMENRMYDEYDRYDNRQYDRRGYSNRNY